MTDGPHARWTARGRFHSHHFGARWALGSNRPFDRAGSRGQAQAVRFSNNSVLCNTEFSTDLGSRQAFAPQLFELIDLVFSPSHGFPFRPHPFFVEI
jgi:hypothetical protein